MTTLRTAVLERALADFRNHAADPENSMVCRHFRREHEASFRIKAKLLWESGDMAETLRFMAEALAREGRFQALHVDRRITPIIDLGKKILGICDKCASGASDAARRRRAGKTARTALRAVAEASDDTLRESLSTASLEQAMNAMLETTPHGNACTALMEFRLDARMGHKAPGTEADRTRTETIARTKGKTEGLDPEGAAYRAAETRLLVAEAREWLVNAGCSLRDGSIDATARIKDIPVGLVELYLDERESRNPGEDAFASTSLAHDALALYRALNNEGEARRYCIVPIERDPLSGAGLYLLGTGLFSDDFIAWLYPDIERRRARLARARRKADVRHNAAKAFALEARRIELDERRIALLRSNTCVLAMVSHAQAVDALARSRVFDSSGFGWDADAGFSSDRRLVQGLFHDELTVWPAPVATETAMKQAIAHFRRALCTRADAGKSGVAAYRAVNEDAPSACPARFRAYFYEDDL